MHHGESPVRRERDHFAALRSGSGAAGSSRIPFSVGMAEETPRSPQSCAAMTRAAGDAEESPTHETSMASSRLSSMCGSNAEMSARARNAAAAMMVRVSSAASRSAARHWRASSEPGAYAPLRFKAWA